MSFQLPDLPYAFDALEPNFDAQTMEIHHDKHHAGYVKNLNGLVAGTEADAMDIDSLIQNISKYPTGVRNNGGGHYNHSLFWTILSPNGGEPSEELLNAINNDLGDMDTLKSAFNEAGAKRFGSGWAWLIVNPGGKLEICSTPNQDTPMMDIAQVKGTPILGCDVWEHAYYLHYQNRRADFLQAFWNIVNWDEVSKRYALATK